MGGLVCRTLIQRAMQERRLNPRSWIHRLVTIGSPHGGIELGRVPDFIERAVPHTLDPFNSGIFNPDNMREYLHIPDDHDVRSLGNSGFG
jgi:triacylglycerol esterase/lipase EstA (alpha/beta hydrolase family)